MNSTPDGWCFACGENNPFGLHLDFCEVGKDEVQAEYLPRREHQGYDDLVHGGIIATLLDEAMAKVLTHQGKRGVTGRLEVRYRAPLMVGEQSLIRGWLDKEKRTGFRLSSEIVRGRDELCIATGSATFMHSTEGV